MYFMIGCILRLDVSYEKDMGNVIYEANTKKSRKNTNSHDLSSTYIIS